jgi:DNA excision repair protein ERCC-3
MLLADPVIAPCKVVREDEEGQQVFGMEKGSAARRDYFIPGTEEARRAERGEVGADGQVQRPGQGQRDDVIGAVIGIDQSKSASRSIAGHTADPQATSLTKMKQSIRLR